MIQGLSVTAGIVCLVASLAFPLAAPAGVLWFLLAAVIGIHNKLHEESETLPDERLDRIIELLDQLTNDSAVVRRIKEIEHHKAKVAAGERK